MTSLYIEILTILLDNALRCQLAAHVFAVPLTRGGNMPNAETPPNESLTDADRAWIAGYIHRNACNQTEAIMAFIALSNGVRTLGTACLSMFFVDAFIALTVLKNRILTPYAVIAEARVSNGTFVVLTVFCLLALASLVLTVVQPKYQRMQLWMRLRLGTVAASLGFMAAAWQWYS